MANRTSWPFTGGSVKINGSHEHALTSINMAIGTNATNFNITLVEMFNQTGAGVYCVKDAGKAHLEAGLKAAGYSGTNDERLEGLAATIQVIQLGHSGAALYNVSFSPSQLSTETMLIILQCADIKFEKNATTLSDDECKNGEGVSSQAIGNVNSSQSSGETPTSSSPPAGSSTNAASVVGPAAGSGLVIALMAWGLL